MCNQTNPLRSRVELDPTDEHSSSNTPVTSFVSMSEPGQRWSEALAAWAIPDAILSQAPTNPWVHPPKMFRSTDDDPSDTPSMRAATALLGDGGCVLDIGCGGGRSSLPLGARLVTEAIGVDEQQAMLDQFTTAAASRSIPMQTVLGRWPAVADVAPVADVVVCHHVVYNVAQIDEFIRALSSHATRGVVVELPDRHPTSPFNGLWKRFWNLDRPTEPSAELFVEVVRCAGYEPHVEQSIRPPRKQQLDQAEFVEFTRQRLCLSPDRDPEIAEALASDFESDSTSIVTVWWRV